MKKGNRIYLSDESDMDLFNSWGAGFDEDDEDDEEEEETR